MARLHYLVPNYSLQKTSWDGTRAFRQSSIWDAWWLELDVLDASYSPKALHARKTLKVKINLRARAYTFKPRDPGAIIQHLFEYRLFVNVHSQRLKIFQRRNLSEAAVEVGLLRAPKIPVLKDELSDLVSVTRPKVRFPVGDARRVEDCEDVFAEEYVRCFTVDLPTQHKERRHAALSAIFRGMA